MAWLVVISCASASAKRASTEDRIILSPAVATHSEEPYPVAPFPVPEAQVDSSLLGTAYAK
jgi:hypothetical protein